MIYMKTQQGSTVIGVFEDRLHANKAITELHQAGFTQNQIGVAMRHSEGVDETKATKSDEPGSHAGTGAITGALTGLGLGGSLDSAFCRALSQLWVLPSRRERWESSFPTRPQGLESLGSLGPSWVQAFQSMKPSTISPNSKLGVRSSRSRRRVGAPKRPRFFSNAGRTT